MSAYVDGELGSGRRLSLERRVGECEECRLMPAGLREMLAVLHRLPAPSGSPSRTSSRRLGGSGYANRPLRTESFFVCVGSNRA
jgi:anti-sigma factor RsiW